MNNPDAFIRWFTRATGHEPYPFQIRFARGTGSLASFTRGCLSPSAAIVFESVTSSNSGIEEWAA